MAEKQSPIVEVTSNRVNDLVSSLRNSGLEFLAKGPANTAYATDEYELQFKKTNTTYSGTDCSVVAVVNSYMLYLGNVATFSYSTFREKVPVRTLGRTYAKGYTYGSRTIGGSLVFITFDEHPLYPLFKFLNNRTSAQHRYTTPLSDDLPPIDIMLIFTNEYGSNSICKLYGVEFVQEGGVFSINDIYSETTLQYVCRDMDPMISKGNEGSWKELLFNKMVEGKFIDNQFATLLEYKRTIEGRANIISDRILKKNKQRTNFNLFNTTVGIFRNANDKLAKKSEVSSDMDKDKKELGLLTDELSKIDNAIRSYERLMSWDQNISVDSTPSDIINPNFFSPR